MEKNKRATIMSQPYESYNNLHKLQQHHQNLNQMHNHNSNNDPIVERHNTATGEANAFEKENFKRKYSFIYEIKQSFDIDRIQ